MIHETATTTPKPPASVREPARREWLWRTVFESALIVLGLLGGFAINEWKEGRDRQQRVDDVVAAIRAEIVSNRRLLEEVNRYNTQVVEALKKLGKQKATVIPASVYPRGLVRRPQLVSAAWDSARASTIINDLPIETVIVLGQMYEAQRDHVERTGVLSDSMYAAFFAGQATFMNDPGNLGGILDDYASRGTRLQGSYDAALKHVDERTSP